MLGVKSFLHAFPKICVFVWKKAGAVARKPPGAELERCKQEIYIKINGSSFVFHRSEGGEKFASL